MYEIIDVNNAKFIFSPFKGIETASLGIFLGVGSRFEKKSVKGIAHFLEHMLFKGSKNYSHLQIKREIEGRGGSLNAFTSQEVTAYYAHFLNKNLQSTLDILCDMVSAPRLLSQDVEKERNVILQEIKMYNDLPAQRALSLLEDLIWPGHALGQEVIGYPKTVNSIKSNDLSNFRDNHYTNDSMVISFSGDFPKDKIRSLLEKKIKKSKRSFRPKPKKPSALSGQYVATEKNNLQQAHLCLGFRGMSYLSPKKLTAQLIHVILGANMSSRLFEELREKKSLCYDISTESRKYKDSGAFIIHMGLEEAKVILALKTIIKELKKIKTKPVPFQEISRAKDYLLGQIAMSLEQPQGRMFYTAESYLTQGKIEPFTKIKESLNQISAKKIRDMAKEIFNFKSMAISCVGNIRDGLDESLKKTVETLK